MCPSLRITHTVAGRMTYSQAPKVSSKHLFHYKERLDSSGADNTSYWDRLGWIATARLTSHTFSRQSSQASNATQNTNSTRVSPRFHPHATTTAMRAHYTHTSMIYVGPHRGVASNTPPSKQARHAPEGDAWACPNGCRMNTIRQRARDGTLHYATMHQPAC